MRPEAEAELFEKNVRKEKAMSPLALGGMLNERKRE